MQALIWTILGALPGPITLALLGLLLQSIGSPGRFSHSLGLACMHLVIPLFAAMLLFWVSKEKALLTRILGGLNRDERYCVNGCRLLWPLYYRSILSMS
jgi:hypothetical protein